MTDLQGGSASVAVAFLTGVVGAALLALGSLVALYGARIQVATAADAAALAAAVATYPPAGADDPLEEAARFAAANGANLEECRCPIDVTMSVRVAEVIVVRKVTVPLFGEMSVRAGARAEFDPAAWLNG